MSQEQPDHDATVRALDEHEFRAVTAGDLAILRELWADDFVVTPPDNIPKDKATVLRLIESGRIAYSETERVVERVIVRDGVVVTVGREVVVPSGDRPDAGQRLVRRYTHVWVPADSTWRLVARHATVVGPPGSKA
jgi:ketosteroid isomerase-like protein